MTQNPRTKRFTFRKNIFQGLYKESSTIFLFLILHESVKNADTLASLSSDHSRVSKFNFLLLSNDKFKTDMKTHGF